jgi:hypothetical protein
MDIVGRRAFRLRALVAVCAVLLAPALAAFLVNLELAIRVLAPGWRLAETVFPERLFRFFTPLAADLSAVSTLVPVLLLVFPLVQGWRILRRQNRDPGFPNRLVFDPYPPFFSFFLAMLGLEGTLYGLFLGLGVSQVADLSASALTADAIHGTLKRLLEGTATAILSSLVGLLGAFVAARPLNWFRRLALLDEVEAVEADSLTETAHRLTGELRALGDASRAFAAELRPEPLRGLFDRLDESARAFTQAAGAIQAMSDRLDRLAEGQRQANELVARLAGQQEAHQRWLEAAWARLEGGLESGRAEVRHLEELAGQAQQTRQASLADAQVGRAAVLEALAALLTDARAGRTDLLGALDGLREAAQAVARENGREREAWRQALAAYLGRTPGPDRGAGGGP